MNRCCLSLWAACRIRSSALGAPTRPCVRGAFCSGGFPLANPLPSTASAAGPSALFGGFVGCIGLSDFPRPFIIGVRLSTSRCGLLSHRQQTAVGSPGSRTRCFRTCTGPLTARGPAAPCHGGAAGVAFRCSPARRHPEVTHLAVGHGFRGSIPACTYPVNASPPPLRTVTHDLRPVWQATPSPYETFIHNTFPV